MKGGLLLPGLTLAFGSFLNLGYFMDYKGNKLSENPVSLKPGSNLIWTMPYSSSSSSGRSVYGGGGGFGK